MINFNLNTQIYRPRKQIFSFVATSENDFQWQYGTLASAQISGGEIGIGTRFRTTGHFMGQRIESVYEVTEFETNKKYGFKSVSGPIDARALYTFEEIKGSTKVTISIWLDPRDLCKAENMTVQKKIKKQYKENLALLKGVLEADPVMDT
jgi:polyketide cyclase/dehydrase/lipid transport protein